MVKAGRGAAQVRTVLHTSRGAYVLLRLLVKQKQGVDVFLGAPVDLEGCALGNCVMADMAQRVVIKVLSLCQGEGALQQAQAEVSALASVLASRPEGGEGHVVPLVDLMQDDRYMFIVMPYLEGGDLFERLTKRGRGLTPHEARQCFADLISGLLELKGLGLAHGDVSPENLAFGSVPADGSLPSAHLIDLGSSKRAGVGLPYKFRGKPSYAPPEAVVAHQQAKEGRPVLNVDVFAADVWSAGICLYVMLTGFPLYSSPHDPAFGLLTTSHPSELLRHYETFGLVLDPLAEDLICAMLHASPSERPTLEDILEHPWVAGGWEAAVAVAAAGSLASGPAPHLALDSCAAGLSACRTESLSSVESEGVACCVDGAPQEA